MSVMGIVSGMKAVSRLLSDAETEANAQGADEVAAEHIVLAALRDPDGGGVRALVAAGGTADGFRASLRRVHADALSGVGISAEVPDVDVPPVTPGRGRHRLTPGGKRLFKAVAEERGSRNDDRALGAQVMAALAGETTGPAVRALDLMGVDRGVLAEAARRELAAG